MRKDPAIVPPSLDGLEGLSVGRSVPERSSGEALAKRREWLSQSGLCEQVRSYQLITPLFGGGVEPGINDDITPINGKSVRGQLRFWWRATRGGQPDRSLQNMKNREFEIWGAANAVSGSCPSRVEVLVDIVDRGTIVRPFRLEHKKDRDGRPEFLRDGSPKTRLVAEEDLAPSYAAFPLQPTAEESKVDFVTKGIQKGLRFSLRIVYPEVFSADVQAALWAWETFGGIGARTRRGFGALSLVETEPRTVMDLSNIERTEQGAIAWIKKQLALHVVEGKWPKNVPHLRRNSVFEICDFRSSSHAVWHHMITNLKLYRQQRNEGNQRNKPGRSKWPEPEQIRSLTGQRLRKHLEDKELLSLKKFPRAAFGLPINFQFNPQDYNRKDPYDSESDPRKTMLTLDDYDRLASPLIIRPIRVSDSQFFGVALVLDGTALPESLKLTLQNAEKKNTSAIATGLQSNLTGSEAALIRSAETGEPLLGKNTDVVFGFLDFLEP